MVFSDWNKPANEFFYHKIDYPIAMSRAVTDFEEIKDYYVDILGGSVIREESYSDGSEWLTIKFSDALTHT